MKISISHYHRQTERSYTTFPVTAEGLRDARELLATKCVNGFRYSLSPWQFEDQHEAIGQAARLIDAGDVDGLTAFLKAQEVAV